MSSHWRLRPKTPSKYLACFRRFHKPSFQLPHALTLSSLDSFLVLRLINPHSVTSQLAFAMYNIMSCHHSAPLPSLPPSLPSRFPSFLAGLKPQVSSLCALARAHDHSH
ncbi:hypothetical protein QQF64_002431 [Cirrhinus molitorella]|uniref:Uncharacterized protein n=1 Tax=Cirrhinus molitorella TaxID=172907 RepID=A0ABR3MQ61_9TELE